MAALFSLSLGPAAERLLVRMTIALEQLAKSGEEIVTAIDDLTAAETAMVAEVAKALTELQALSAQVSTLSGELAAAAANNDQAQVVAVTEALKTATANLDAGLASAAASLPAPAPSPTA